MDFIVFSEANPNAFHGVFWDPAQNHFDGVFMTLYKFYNTYYKIPCIMIYVHTIKSLIRLQTEQYYST